MFTLLLLVVIVVVLVLVLFDARVPQKTINILLLVIAALVILNSAGWRLNL